MNRNKRLVQAVVVVLGALMLLPSLYQALQTGAADLTSRSAEQLFKRLSKPAEAGIYGLVALFLVRLALKSKSIREHTRWLFRLLQIIHIPLGFVVFASAVAHGLLFLLFQFKNDFHSWSGIVALALMAAAVAAGLFIMKRPARNQVHRLLGLVTFVAVLVHIFTVGGEGGERERGPERRRPRSGSSHVQTAPGSLTDHKRPSR